MSFSRPFRRIALAFVVGLLFTLLPGAPWALAGKTSSTEHWQTSTPVSFTINPAPNGCYQVETPIYATGELRNEIELTTYPDGSRRVIDKGHARGTAVDDAGKRYRFNYENTATFTLPPSGAIVYVEMQDSFTLKGRARENQVSVRFHWLWTSVPSDPGANPTVATIPWPPSDNWVQFESIGEPLSCDPI